MSPDPRPWLKLYGPGRPTGLVPGHPTMLAAYRASVRRAPDTVVLRYFDGETTLADLDRASDALAVALRHAGFTRGDRLALYLQNDPAFVVGLLAAWKAGGSAVPINPMNRAGELTYVLRDSGARALLCLDDLWADVAREVVGGGTTDVRLVVTVNAREGQRRDEARVLTLATAPDVSDTVRLADLFAAHDGAAPDPVTVEPGDVAVLTYTSGTTGRPKGAMNTQAGLVFTSCVYRDWMGLTSGDSILGIAPLFHITGLVGHTALALLLPCPLVLTHRFHPEVMVEALREHRPTFTVAAITALTAMVAASTRPREDFSSLRALYSGGAAIAPAVSDAFLESTGVPIHTIYGLTETTSPTHAAPLGARAPVDPATGALSIGVPVFGTGARVLTDDGQESAPGEIGEIVVTGPQVVPGYWNRSEETAETMPGGELRTGDVGFMDALGWFYLVDRKKDLIIAGGYKVWPREVEDLLYTHPAVREAAVIGVPDDYRGETVKAVVTLRPGAKCDPGELIAFARERLSVYKCPRIVEIVDELPKTATGKILRRALRTSQDTPS
ncbi:class I adenylate-forming enzyme family protein [Streptomyces justiciae]|uniref:class I adenylate-forming enzyme family protein n=1 Tax=Streptomyces justiciae TaxID=2780140 RepID=UPI0021173DF3|nr:AMP-binding protein [Streptomyces justiciae]MCW8378714.1 AMP-binding protein [Streptomyces justiciae]